MKTTKPAASRTPPPDHGGSGAAALSGFDYQIDVSVWLGLDLLLDSRLTKTLVLEPASEEDLEADLDASEPSRVVASLPLGSYRLVVQVKFRDGDAWTLPTLNSLLKHGSDNRPSAASRLKDSDARYLLVTTASLNGPARRLRVRRAGQWPKADVLPASMQKLLPPKSAGRVAVISGFEDTVIEREIRRLLTESFRVPNSRWRACRTALRKEVRRRILGAGAGVWRTDELEAVIRRFDGYIASSPELDAFVYPTNWQDLKNRLRDRNGVLILGQSGTGKTLATRRLYDELRAEDAGLTRVPVRLGPHEIRDDMTELPVLFDVEDPWGRFDFDPKSRPWTDQLGNLFTHATAGRRIVVTSRLDVAEAARIPEELRPWIVPLEAEHYGPDERRRLYETRVGALPRGLQLQVKQARSDVLDELATPLEIQKFFDAVPTRDAKLRGTPGLIREAIRIAHQNSIEATVVHQIEERDDLAAAAVIWALIKAFGRISGPLLRDLEADLAEADDAMARGVAPLAGFFVAARNLKRSSEGDLTYYHPRVEAGMQAALLAQPLLARRTLKSLVQVLASPDMFDPAWGAAAAARVTAAAASVVDLKIKPGASAQGVIDAWLESRLAQAGSGFEEALRLAALAGSPDSGPCEAARFLQHKRGKTLWDLVGWADPGRPTQWYARLSNDPATRHVVETFVREVLPLQNDRFGIGFADAVERLLPNTAAAVFRDAALRMVGFGVDRSAGAVAHGALKDLGGFAPVVDEAVAIERGLQRAPDRTLHLERVNELYGVDWWDHAGDEEDGYTAGVFLGAYVDALRNAGRWRTIDAHPYREFLLWHWIKGASTDADAGRSDRLELDALLAAAQGGRRQAEALDILVRAWDPARTPTLVGILNDPASADQVMNSALVALAVHAPDALAAAFTDLAGRGEVDRLVRFSTLMGLLGTKASAYRKADRVTACRAVALLPAPFGEFGPAVAALAKNQVPTLTPDALAVLSAVPDASLDVRRLRIAIDQHVPMPVDDDIDAVLADEDEDEPEMAIEAIESAIRRGRSGAISAGLIHRFGHVQARALKAVAAPLMAPLPADILAFAGSPLPPTLVAFGDMLAGKPHPDHLPALLTLTSNTWSKSHARYYDEDDVFPIARQAVKSIADLGPIDKDVAAAIYKLGIETSDPGLRVACFDLVADRGDPAAQLGLLRLAADPGRRAVRIDAANALLFTSRALDAAIPALITAKVLASRIAPIAVRLALLLGHVGTLDSVVQACRVLATHPARQALVIAMIWTARDRDPKKARDMAAFLPPGHPAATWALATDDRKLPADALDDLGDVEVAEALRVFTDA